VEATQEVTSESLAQNEIIPIRVQKDMVFLRESWANMAKK